MAKMTYRKKKLFPLCTEADEAKAAPVLAALKAKGFSVADKSETPNGRGVMLLFLSENLTEDQKAAETFFACDAKGVETVPVNLDGSDPPELLKNALYSRNTIFAGRYSAEELAERIATAKPFEAARKPLPLILAAAAAVLVIAGAAVLISRLRPAEETTAPETTPSETAGPVIPAQAGLLPEDLEKVHELIIVGDTLNYFTGEEKWVSQQGLSRVGADHYATRTEEDLIAHWYSKEDGHEIQTAAWNDLDFLRYMKNVQFITLVRVRGELPDLSGLEKLDVVELFESEISGIGGLGSTKIVHFGYSGNTLTDFSPLSACPRLGSVSMTLYDPIPEDLSSFGPPSLTSLAIDSDSSALSVDLSGLKNCTELTEARLDSLPLADLSCLSECRKLRNLDLLTLTQLESLKGLEEHQQLTQLFVDYNCENLRDMSALAGNTSLRNADLHNRALSDLSWLAGAKDLEELQLWDPEGLRSLNGLEDHARLRRIKILNAEQLGDISALQSCAQLQELTMHNVFALADVSPVVKLPQLKRLEIYGSQLDDVDFLSDIVNKSGFSFGIAEVTDWSGLEVIKNYDYLNVTDRTGSCLPYLKDATVRFFELYCRSGVSDWSREPLDWSMFPKVTEDLTLHGVVSLKGMPALPVTGLFLDDSQTLTSLEGLQNLANAKTGMLWLQVKGCPRLADWSALNEMKLAQIACENTFSFPDFAALDAKSIRIDTPVELRDLHCFDGMDPQKEVSVELYQTLDVQDLSPLYALKKGNMLRVPAHLGEQAKLLVESGNFRDCEILYPDEWWEPARFDVKLLSLDELDTLPAAVLKRIENLSMVGDVIFSWDDYRLDQEWHEDGSQTFILRSNDGNESHDITIDNPGTLTDFSKLAQLTGLRNLSLFNQSFTSLEGAQALQDLRKLEIADTPSLTDASAAFTLQELEELHLQNTGITNVTGIQNLTKLRQADLNGCRLDDLSPLAGLPEDCDLMFKLPLMTTEEFLALPDSMLSRIREIGFFGAYVMSNPWGDIWFEEDWYGDGAALYLHDNSSGERIPLEPGPVTELSFLERLPKLRELHLYVQPLQSLDGIETLENLTSFNSRWTKIADLSHLFALPQIRNISVTNTETLRSVEGAQEAAHLRSLCIGGTGVSDLSPLAGIDYAECMKPDEDGRIPGFDLSVDNLSEQLSPDQYRYLSSVPRYGSLNIFNTDCALWTDALKDIPIREIHAGGCGFTDKTFRTFVEQHPELEYIKVSWTETLTDLSPVLALPNLRAVCVSGSMQDAIRSLGNGYGFQLETE